jgi:hypothetical protein
MKKGTIIGAILVFLVGLGLMWWGSGSQSTASSGSNAKNALTVSEKIYDFDTTSMAKGKVDHIFRVTNPTDKDVVLKRIGTSCMCTNAYIASVDGEKGPFGMEGHGYVPPADETIKAGESRDVRVVFDPNAHGPAGVGLIDRFIYLTDASGGTLELEIKTVVTP